jgi:hypothetical protein
MVVTVGRSAMNSPVLSILRWGLSMTFLWPVLGGSEVSPVSYPHAGRSTPARR